MTLSLVCFYLSVIYRWINVPQVVEVAEDGFGFSPKRKALVNRSAVPFLFRGYLDNSAKPRIEHCLAQCGQVMP